MNGETRYMMIQKPGRADGGCMTPQNGKTALLDLLAQRKTEGTINGSILVDGRPLPVSFQRSGLDGQSAYNTARFLRRLADAGQAVLVTVHQPSAHLFAEFDQIVFLAKGGKTVYFGPIRENAAAIEDHFSRHGAPCPPETNPAEHMLDVVSGQLSQGRDWSQLWLESPEHNDMIQELDSIIEEAAAKPQAVTGDGRELACTLWEQTVLKRGRY
ncbi:uncharacterized protein N7515_008347 [Penicillium bovifimosum]|uniref:ABC transporter family G domain-containing protein n=1 Tax=Penicillium bovifimosum TaxID=126998 RepID=A0A9W9GN45_9EURO|nr:uncharacterized protein N7515_008347 [Penicillium bovifimosum]KAJ5124522.1 hypothetical protein N7515_008347 [Penicillium bovifimosum]